ncbi:MAG: GDP-fucose synthetase [Euryarchaeota archaeon]|nr:GDP-fucose synthetase [Euryarchaeota archaeon]|tara:strand:- start:8152 stop:9069 length:918 start_codon:yes stop_codon:yes gene_type:complete
MRVIIFGSNGLVGKSLTNVLQLSDKVDFLFPSTREDTDLEELNSIRKVIEENKPDYIVNCAAKVGGIHANNTYRADFLIDNLKINLNLYEVLKDFKNINIINLGSSCIYPLNAPDPISESSFMNGKLEPTNSPYAIAKITSIELGREISNQFGNRVLNLMPTNLYGPNDNFSEMNSHVIPGLIYRMHESKINNNPEFKIWGSGKPLREFMYVDDLSNCIEFLLGLETKEDLINVGTGEEISILELANLIKNIIGFEGSIKTDLNMPDGNPRKLLDSSLINKIGWKYSIDLENGLEKTYDWYLKNK